MKKAACLLASSLLFTLCLLAQSTPTENGVRAFHEVAAVLTSPRCLNCHVPDDGPLQGDDNHTHIMKVARGTDGAGASLAMRCSNCHQDSNVATPHAPPGAPGWRMPPAATRMAWQGLTVSQLCKAIKDPAVNGKKSLTDLVEHVTSDKIVTWGWSPGPGRLAPPISHERFVDAFKIWVSAGAPCPE